MAKRKKAKHNHTTRKSRAKARRRSFNRHVNRSVAKNRKAMHYAWDGFKRQVYNFFYRGYITTGNALAHHRKHARRKIHHTHARRKSKTTRRTRTKRRIRTPYRRNLHKSLAFSRGLHKAKKSYTKPKRSLAKQRTKRIRSPYRTNLKKRLRYNHGFKKTKHRYSRHRVKHITKRYAKYRRSKAIYRTHKKTYLGHLRKTKGIKHSIRRESVGRGREHMRVMTGGTGRELGAKDTGRGFRGATAPEVLAASHNSEAKTIKKHKTSSKRKTIKKRRAKKTTKKRRTKRVAKKHIAKKTTRKHSTAKKKVPKKNTVEEEEISELRDQLAELKEQNNNMQKIVEQMKQTVLTMQGYRDFNTSLNQQAAQQLNAQNDMSYDGMRQQMATTRPSVNNTNSMTHTIDANLTNRNNQLEADDMHDPALNNTNYGQSLSGNPIPGDTSRGRFYAQPAIPSPNGDPNQYYFDNFEDAYKEAHLNDNNTYENGTSYAQNGRNGIIMDLDPMQQAKAIELYQQKQMPQITTQVQPAPSISVQATTPSAAYTAPTPSYNQQATVAAQTAAQNEQANRDKAAIQAEANSQKIDTIKNTVKPTVKPQTSPTAKPEAKKANVAKKPIDAKQASSLKKPKQPTTYVSIDVNIVDPALAYNNKAKTQSYGLSQ